MIARALSKNARVLILDEPTAALTDHEAQRLFDRMRALRARGVGVIFVSHRLAEVFAIADRIVVMRDGRIAADMRRRARPRATTSSRRWSARGGRAPARRRGAGAAGHDRAASVDGARGVDAQRDGRRHVDGLSFGAAHTARSSACSACSARAAPRPRSRCSARGRAAYGAVRVDGREVRSSGPADAIAHGIGLMAQDRRDSLMPEHSVLDNSLSPACRAVSPRGFARQVAASPPRDGAARSGSAIKAPVDRHAGRHAERRQPAEGADRPLARLAAVKVLLLVDPTRGVDVGARAEITRIWRELAATGYALLLVSSDAEELVDALRPRRSCCATAGASAELHGAGLSEEHLLRAAAGV